MDDERWYERTREAWEVAAAELEAQGYTRQDGLSFWKTEFVKGDSVKALVRSLGKLDWRPIVLG